MDYYIVRAAGFTCLNGGRLGRKVQPGWAVGEHEGSNDIDNTPRSLHVFPSSVQRKTDTDVQVCPLHPRTFKYRLSLVPVSTQAGTCTPPPGTVFVGEYGCTYMFECRPGCNFDHACLTDVRECSHAACPVPHGDEISLMLVSGSFVCSAGLSFRPSVEWDGMDGIPSLCGPRKRPAGFQPHSEQNIYSETEVEQ